MCNDINNINDNFFTFLETNSNKKPQNVVSKKTEKQHVVAKKKRVKNDFDVIIANQKCNNHQLKKVDKMGELIANQIGLSQKNNIKEILEHRTKNYDYKTSQTPVANSIDISILPKENVEENIHQVAKKKVNRNKEQYLHKMKGVISLDGQFEFASAVEAAKYFNKSKSAIVKAISTGVRCVGKYWKYKDEDINPKINIESPTIPIIEVNTDESIDLSPIFIKKDFLVLGRASFPAIMILSYMHSQAKLQNTSKMVYKFKGYYKMNFYGYMLYKFHLHSTVVNSALRYLEDNYFIIPIVKLLQPHEDCSWEINNEKILNQIEYNKKFGVKFQVRERKINNIRNHENKLSGIKKSY